jgi:hypothetical protein
MTTLLGSGVAASKGNRLPSANRSAAKQVNIADDFAGLQLTAERLIPISSTTRGNRSVSRNASDVDLWTTFQRPPSGQAATLRPGSNRSY